MAFVGCDGGGSLTERNKALVREYAREEDKGGIDFIQQYIDPHFVFHYPNRVKLQGLERLNKSVVNFQKAFPDGKHTILDQIAEGDKVVTRYTWTGTHLGEFMGIAPTGKKVTFSMIDIVRIQNGKIIEAWVEYDVSVFERVLRE